MRWIAAVVMTAMLAACSSSGDREASRPTPPPPPHKAVPSASVPPLVTEAPDSWLEAACDLPVEYVKRIRRGFYPGSSPDILFVPREPNFFGSFSATSHSGPWDYVQEVPLVFYGPGFIASNGEIEPDREVTLADLAPTMAKLLRTPFPTDRPGRVIDEVLEPDRRGVPKLILTVVWDGGGWNVLNTWPNTWPFLKSIMSKGTAVMNATVGSSPSVTPSIHSTIGTGAYPRQHGIVDIPIRVDGEIVGAFPGNAKNLKLPTLADMFDMSVDNAAEVGMFAFRFFHSGMMGHGALLPGADHDIAIIGEREDSEEVTSAGVLSTNDTYYYLPPYVHEIGGFENDVKRADLDDGKRDFKWLGHIDLQNTHNVRHSPPWVRFQTRLIETVMDNEGFGDDDVPDLFYVNYKEIDDVGHNWNMLYPEMREILKYSDGSLHNLVRWLNDKVGRRQWVIALTADHGQAPDPQAVHAWPIHMSVLKGNVAHHFGVEGDELFDTQRPVGFWLNRDTLEREDITAEDISDYLIRYTIGDDIKESEGLPAQYEDRLQQLLFASAFPADKLDQVRKCVKENA